VRGGPDHSSRWRVQFTPRRNVLGFNPLTVRSFNVEDRDVMPLPPVIARRFQGIILRIVLC
jgi:hypothetical protein